MPSAEKSLFGGTLGTTSATLYTAPATPGYAIITEIILANKTATVATATITRNGINIVAAKSVPANDSLVIPLKTIVGAGEIVAGLSGTASAIDCTISGIEVT